jgi:SepF-like predicted cell division protein (DUF552 family)
MTSGFMKRKHFKKGKEAAAEGDYIDLGIKAFEGEEGALEGITGLVRLAELYRYEDLSHLTTHVYNGNILLIDYTTIANDELTLRRIVNELKSVARDTHGDVAGIGKNMLIVTPQGIKVDRNKLKGPY